MSLSSLVDPVNETDAVFNDTNCTITIHNVTQIIMQDNAYNAPRETQGVTNLIIGLFMVILNGLLIKALYSQQRCLNWKRFACILNLSISDFICGTILFSRGINDLIIPKDFLDGILNLEICASIFMTILNYDCQLSVQYLAIKKPIYYRTSVSLSKILMVIALLWITILSYTGIKLIFVFDEIWGESGIFFKSVDITAMGLSLIFNTVFYSFVLRVTTQKRRESITRRRLSDKLSISSTESESAPVIRQSIFYQYNSVITMGLQLVTYISTISPLFVYWIYSSIYSVDHQELSDVFVSFWFVRGILDPLTFLLRERRLLSICTLPNCGR